jgi:CubicO group peptidase (beta-lactamase class C family)
VVVVVKDREILFAKGYGYADLESKRPMDPEKTLVRVGSISKLLTATAVMQLAEAGKLTLEDDVNQHLKGFQLDKSYTEPITFAHLLTHTHGFDSHYIGEANLPESDLTPLGPYLVGLGLRRVRPPGEWICYSNYGYGLAGYLAEEISGVPFAVYVDRHILQPLEMHRSGFDVPARLKPDLAVGYRYERGALRPLPNDSWNLWPAAGFKTTAADMAHFMIAHLQDGRWKDGRILLEDTAKEMHRQHFTNHPRLPGWAYGFYVGAHNGERTIEHGGELFGFLSELVLLPDRGVGVFVATNRGGTPNLPDEFLERFFDHYYPEPATVRPAQVTDQDGRPAERFAGTYREIATPQRSLEKFCALMGYLGRGESPELKIRANRDGTISLMQRFVEIEPQVFQRLDGKVLLAFRENEQGRVTHVLIDRQGVYERLPWYAVVEWRLAWAFSCVLVLLSACLIWPLGYLARRLRKKTASGGRLASRARWVAGLVCALDVTFLVGLATYLVVLDPGELYYGAPKLMTGLLIVPLLAAPLTGALPILCVCAWKCGCWTLPGRLYYSLVTVASLAYIPLLIDWRLLGFSY